MVFLPVLVLLWACRASAEGRLRKFYLEQTQNLINISEAHSICQRNYTDLVTVYDLHDQKELVDVLSKHNASNAWIGVCNSSRSVQWSNGEDVTFRKLTNNDTQIWCSTMNANGNWDSMQCNTTQNFLCYEIGNEQEYKYIPIYERKTWYAAQEYCREKHIDLVTIRNEIENQQVYTVSKNSFTPMWIGLSNDLSLSWFDGGQSNYRKILELNNQMFIYLDSTGSWSQSTETKSKSALCYKSFIHVSTSEMSWENAMDYCDRNASGPLCIESKNDQIEIQRELRRQKITDPVWVGLRKSRLFGFWIWTNGLHVGPWTNWKGVHQPKHQMSHHCGAIDVAREFKWSDKDCRSKFKVLCEKNV